ncbi:hypothetical protein FRX31_003342, partial [Thalictrum thalictroides]
MGPIATGGRVGEHIESGRQRGEEVLEEKQIASHEGVEHCVEKQQSEWQERQPEGGEDITHSEGEKKRVIEGENMRDGEEEDGWQSPSKKHSFRSRNQGDTLIRGKDVVVDKGGRSSGQNQRSTSQIWKYGRDPVQTSSKPSNGSGKSV